MLLLDGNLIAQRIRDKVAQRVSSLPTPPGLAVLLVGDDPASQTYVTIKQKACEEAGIRFEKYVYAADASEDELISRIGELNARKDITGILVQLPLPEQDADRVIAALDPDKDVDGFHRENMRRLKAGEPGLVPAVALGIMKLIDATEHPIRGLRAAIVASELFAEPLVELFAEQAVSSDVISPDDPSLPDKTKTADILIIAVGRPNFIVGEMVKPGAIIIDVGTTKVHGKLLGDVDRASVEPVAGFLTPVPGGVGPMTVAMLLANVVKAAQL